MIHHQLFITLTEIRLEIGMEYSLKIENLQKRYTDFSLQNISFGVPNGSIVGLIGENGAGKSTTIKLILELINKDGGNVTFWNKKLDDIDKEDIGVVFDECNFHEVLSARQISNIMGNIYKRWDNEKFKSLLDYFSLPSDKKIKDFSKGMKMKLSIAVALSHNPKLLILDEATSGLDPIVRDQMLDLFLDFIQDEKHSILMSSHITSDLEKIADYVTFIHEGDLIFSESKDKLLYGYGIIKCNTKTFESLNKDEIEAYIKEDFGWKVLVKDRDEMLHKYKGLVIDQPTIDEIMLIYVKGERR
jgi:ABC-2 type transport system ATP-binding protein